MNKKIFFASIFCGLFSTVKCQLYINDAQLTIQNGAIVVVQGDVTSNMDITGDGKVVLKGTNTQSISMGGKSISNLEIDNPASAVLTSHAVVGSNLFFTNGHLQIGQYNLTFNPLATSTNAGNTSHIVTNGSGKVIKAALGTSAFTYAIGNTNDTYNPVTISNSGTTDSIAVRCLATANTTGLTGVAFTKEVVDASWDISESVVGGSNLSVTASWNASDELTGFNRIKSGISNYITFPSQNAGWDLLNNQTAAANGAGPYSYTRNNISNLGAFAIGSRPVLSPLLLSAKIFLQGCYVGNNLMSDNLRILNVIPLTEPYTQMNGFTHSGSGGLETTRSAIVGSSAPSGNDAIVDWVFVQLHQSSDSQIVSSRAALLQRDGDIVDTDGVSPLNMAGNASGSYFISVRHRNHLGTRSQAAIALNKTTTSNMNFTSSLYTAYAGTISNNPLATVGNNTYGLWAANTNDDHQVNMTGLSVNTNDYLKLISAVPTATNAMYSKQDVNMDGTISIAGTSNDFDTIVTVLDNNTTKTIQEPSF